MNVVAMEATAPTSEPRAAPIAVRRVEFMDRVRREAGLRAPYIHKA